MCSWTKTLHPVTAPPLDHIFLKGTPNALDTLRGKSQSRKMRHLRRRMSLVHQMQAVMMRWKMIGKRVHPIMQVSLQSDHICTQHLLSRSPATSNSTPPPAASPPLSQPNITVPQPVPQPHEPFQPIPIPSHHG